MDGSPASLHALKESIRLAQWARSGVTVITVAPSYEGDLNLVGVRNIKAVLHGQCEEILNAAMEVAEEQGTAIGIICEEGHVDEKIVEHSEKEDADIIVLGNSGRRLLHELLTGGVISRISRSSRRDILVIPHNKELAWNRILLVLDRTDGEDIAERAVTLTGTIGGELTVLFRQPGFFGSQRMVSNQSDSSIAGGHAVLEHARKVAAMHGIKLDGLVRKGPMARTIDRVARERRADLIVLAPRAETWLQQMTGPTPAERVARRSQCSLLILKGRDRHGLTRISAEPSEGSIQLT